MMMARTCDCVSTHVSRAPEVCDIIIITLNPPLMSGERGPVIYVTLSDRQAAK